MASGRRRERRDEEKWLPAFAGMTAEGKNKEWRRESVFLPEEGGGNEFPARQSGDESPRSKAREKQRAHFQNKLHSAKTDINSKVNS